MPSFVRELWLENEAGFTPIWWFLRGIIHPIPFLPPKTESLEFLKNDGMIMDDSFQKDQSNLDTFFQMFDWVDEDISELNEDEENEVGCYECLFVSFSNFSGVSDPNAD